MPNAGRKILVVDDEESITTSLSQIFTTLGYGVQFAADGFSALSEIRKQVPDIILSDLNMPGMSGFEFLSVVRRRFPAIQVIAMSAAFSGDGVPPGVAADAFYEKGTGIDSLLRMLAAICDSAQPPSPDRLGTLAAIWIPKNGHDQSERPFVLITCPECLRTFPQSFADGSAPIYEAECVYCSSPIHYAIVEPKTQLSGQAFQRKPGSGAPNALGVPDFNV